MNLSDEVQANNPAMNLEAEAQITTVPAFLVAAFYPVFWFLLELEKEKQG